MANDLINQSALLFVQQENEDMSRKPKLDMISELILSKSYRSDPSVKIPSPTEIIIKGGTEEFDVIDKEELNDLNAKIYEKPASDVDPKNLEDKPKH